MHVRLYITHLLFQKQFEQKTPSPRRKEIDWQRNFFIFVSGFFPSKRHLPQTRKLGQKELERKQSTGKLRIKKRSLLLIKDYL